MNKKSIIKHSIRRWMILCCLLCFYGKNVYAQFYSVKVDAVGLATTTFNVEGSMALGKKWSLHMPVEYNPWTFSGNKKIKHISLQPGARYWFGQSYSSGYFLGMNAIASRYNVGGFVGKYRRDGWATGLGISGGYVIPFHRRWNLEFELGLGYVWSKYDKYECKTCGKLKEEGASGFYLSPNKAAVGIVYLF